MKKAFIPPILRPDVRGSYYDIAGKKSYELKDKVNIAQILDLQERSKIIKKLFGDNLALCEIEVDLIEELKSFLVMPVIKE